MFLNSVLLEIVTFLFATKFSTFHSNAVPSAIVPIAASTIQTVPISTPPPATALYFLAVEAVAVGGGGVAAVTFASGAVDVSTNDGVLLM